jgi:hypothetical protein
VLLGQGYWQCDNWVIEEHGGRLEVASFFVDSRILVPKLVVAWCTLSMSETMVNK